MEITLRPARQSDRNNIVSFCVNTFSWGDYISQVWDIWLTEKDSTFIVAETPDASVGIAHASLCPDNRSVWLEGVRVRHEFRRSGVASKLMDSMLEYGITNGATEALAIVSGDNSPSRGMMEKFGFVSITEWSYFSGSRPIQGGASTARIATPDDLKKINEYLDSSIVFEKSAGRYFKSWRWYRLDPGPVRLFLDLNCIVVTGDPIDGMAIVNKSGYWDRKDVMQIVYMDSSKPDSINDMLSFVARLRDEGFQRLQILCHEILADYVSKSAFDKPERFLLYHKKLLPPR